MRAEDVAIPLKDGSNFSLSWEEVEIFETTYPGIDIRQELLKISAWNMSNPSKRKTKRGIMRHINQWLVSAKPPTSTRDRSLRQDLTDKSWAR